MPHCCACAAILMAHDTLSGVSRKRTVLTTHSIAILSFEYNMDSVRACFESDPEAT
jgi:hypothetical protein